MVVWAALIYDYWKITKARRNFLYLIHLQEEQAKLLVEAVELINYGAKKEGLDLLKNSDLFNVMGEKKVDG